MLFASWAEGFKKHSNQLPRFDQNVSNMAGGVPDIAYYHSYWKLAPDEALVIDATPPECEHWNFQLNNYWMESLDYRYYPVHVNKHTAKYRPMARCRWWSPRRTRASTIGSTPSAMKRARCAGAGCELRSTRSPRLGW